MKNLIVSFALLIALGISACSPTFPLVQDTRPPTPTPCVPLIKANINGKGERRYFTPDSINYKNVKVSLPGEKLYCTEAEAKADGFIKAGK